MGRITLPEALQAARLMVFDFDGTLVDSNEIKWKGFEATFLDFPDQLEEILKYCRGSNHTPRDEKFRHVSEAILGRPYTTEMAERLHERFRSVTTEAIVNAHEIPGAGEFLKCSKAHCETAVLSSTPHAVLIDILEKRGWTDLFDQFQGAPVDKKAWLLELREDRGLPSAEIVFFGDTPEDAAAAREAGCRFVAVANDDLNSDADCFLRDFDGAPALLGGSVPDANS